MLIQQTQGIINFSTELAGFSLDRSSEDDNKTTATALEINVICAHAVTGHFTARSFHSHKLPVVSQPLYINFHISSVITQPRCCYNACDCSFQYDMIM